MPFSSRFEDTHIVAGSGHGKTQLLQQMILKDLTKLEEGQGSVVVIDSQEALVEHRSCRFTQYDITVLVLHDSLQYACGRDHDGSLGQTAIRYIIAK
jgi:ABC-type transporter Mla maintaining outer membrane lipid asymmetry ATPase subunit MlaF